MKLKVVFVTLFVALVAASLAVAAPPPGKGKPPPEGEKCRPKVSLILKGTLANDPDGNSVQPFTLRVNVTRTNRHARAYRAESAQPASVMVDAKTRIRRRGPDTLAALSLGDRVLVRARVCKAALANGATPALTATRIVARPAKRS